MQYFVSKTSPRAILVLFDRGDLMLEGLQEVVRKEKIDTAAITGGIGSFSRVQLHTITTTGFPTADKFWGFTGPIELGSVVAYRAEASLTVLEGVQTERYNDADGNFRIRQKS